MKAYFCFTAVWVIDHHKMTFLSLYFRLKKLTCCVELVHIWQELRATQSSCKHFRRMFYQGEAYSGTKHVTCSQSRSTSCPPCRESGKSCIWHVKGCSNSDGLKQLLKLCYSHLCARRTWRKKGQKQQRSSFWLEVKPFLAYQESWCWFSRGWMTKGH